MALWNLLALFGIALLLVVKSSDYFVHFAAKTAKRFGVSEFVIGLTLVAIGTSLPELTNAVISAYKGVNELALGNVLGSNMANIGLSIGLSIFLVPIVITPWIYKREVWVLLVSTGRFTIASIDGVISSTEGTMLVLLCLLYLAYVGKVFGTLERSVRPAELTYFIDYLGRLQHVVSLNTLRSHYDSLTGSYRRFAAFWTGKALLDVLGMIVSAMVLMFAADMLVDNAIELAAALGITSAAVGATIVALGTTTPELSVSIASVRKGYHRMLIGNIVGSNIVNILLIVGLSAVILPLAVPTLLLYAVYPLLLAATSLFAYMLLRRGTVHRWMGVVFIAVYLAFLVIMWFL